MIEVSVSLKYIGEELYKQLEYIATTKNYNARSKKALIEFVLQDYVNMNQLKELENPYALEFVKSVIDARCQSMEKNIGGRLTNLVAENAIQLGITNQIVYESLNRLTFNDETKSLLGDYRKNAVEQLRVNKKPLNYLDLLKEDGK